MKWLLPLLLATLPAAASAQVLHVPGDHPDVAGAVSAAPWGATILVAPGAPSGGPILIDGKALSLVADGGPATLGQVAVRNLPAGGTVLLSGLVLDATGGIGVPGTQEAFIGLDNQGALRLEGCTLLAQGGVNGWWGDPGVHPDGYSAAWLRQCASVVLHACTLAGGPGSDLEDEDLQAYCGSGGAALYVRDSLVAAIGCAIAGGRGGIVSDTVGTGGGAGGSAVAVFRGQAHAAGCSLTGGDGGSADCDILFMDCGQGGAGGHGVWLQTPAALASIRDNAYDPGAGGGAFLPELVGAPGLPYQLDAGQLTGHPNQVPSLDLASPVREQQTGSVTLGGVGPGLTWFLALGLQPVHLDAPALQGPWLVLPDLPLLALGVQPGWEPVVLSFTLPELGPGLEALTVWLQAAVLSPGPWDLPGPTLGPAAALVLLDSGA